MIQYIWQRPEWPKFTWDDARLLTPLGECRLLQGKLLTKVSTLGLALEHQAQAEILVEEAVKTAAIEGEQLDVRSVRSSVARRLGLPSAGLPVDRRIDDLVSVLLDATQNFEKQLTKERLWGWQAALFPSGYSGMHKIKVGDWRDSSEPMRVVSGPIGREKIHYEAPPAGKLDKEMERFFSWWKESTANAEGIIRAAIAHFWFVTIHPFDDGNGRIARVLTDMALAQDDKQHNRYYSLSTQIMAERETYYTILENTQKGNGDITDWLVWFLGCFARAIERSETILAGVFMRAEFWRKHAEVTLSDRQKKVINRVLEEGPSGFEGGLTTRKYASIGKVSRATAFRELDQLVELGILKRSGKGRSVSYELPANTLSD
ncbi:Fic family protein [Geotalea uraniireducens]|uniref:Filamentation induced by cAMP protein Fic n=1 Tax=Geotalea uraniireducens (strain Rf4) TaxID=351605 RepID=A5G620_GEOUR|nr:Fic family protein [Geotalea uraniireducens]ABQ27238.1 filamentation induced by cAMP protein Fic [Geotalea uraniireducens Rf4]